MEHVTVFGLGRFGLRVAHHLRERGVRTIVVTHPGTRADRIALATSLGAELVLGDFRFADVRARAEVGTCRALILASSETEASLEAALDVRSERPDLPIVMRLSEEKLAHRLREDFGIDAYVPPALSAPHFVEAALGEALPEPSSKNRTRKTSRSRRPPRHFTAPLAFALSLTALFVLGVAIFSRALKISPLDAAYFTATTLTTVGYGDISLGKESAPIKLFGIALMFGGVFLIAGLSSLFTTFVVSGSPGQMRAEWLARTRRGHVIVCGLGSVGAAVAQGLAEAGARVVIVDSTPADERAMAAARRFPLIVGDATHPDVLLRAGFLRARAIVAAVSSDAVNLEIGLMARSLVEDVRPERPLRIVLRCFDPEMENRVRAVSKNYVLLSSARLAAPVFVDKALDGSLL